MKYPALILSALLPLSLTACAQKQTADAENQEVMNKKVLVAYFSATGSTKSEARLIAEATSGTLFEITPAVQYTSADLDWNDPQSRSSVEMNDASTRPALKQNVTDMEQYAIVFLGYPIWWDLAPRIVNTFIESNDLEGKTVIPFATSGGSSISNSVTELKKKYPGINWQEGRLLNGADSDDISRWLKKARLFGGGN